MHGMNATNGSMPLVGKYQQKYSVTNMKFIFADLAKSENVFNFRKVIYIYILWGN